MGVLQTISLHTQLMVTVVHDSRFTIARLMQAIFIMVAILLPDACYFSMGAEKIYGAPCTYSC